MSDIVRRSWLLVPVDDAAQVEQAASADADVVVLDVLELVPESAKPVAREHVQEAIGLVRQGGAEVFVQVDKELLYADLMAAVWPGLSGILIPRLESVQELAEAEALLLELEDKRGLRPGTLQIIGIVDTAKGNYDAMSIARLSPRLWGLTLGRADLVMDLRPEPSGDIHLMPYLMQRLITIATAAGVVPLGAWWRAPARGLLAPPQETYEAAVRGRHIGFKGALCLRPYQVEPLNRGFTPAASEVEDAQELITAYETVAGNGVAVVRLGDRIVDLATVAQARQLLAHADICARRDAGKVQFRHRVAC
jgi:citrate lyase subunit beta/citryl-CoA lyase